MQQILVQAVFQASSEPNGGRMCQVTPDLAAQPVPTTADGVEVEIEFPRFEGRFPADGFAAWWGTDVTAPEALSPAYFTVRTTVTLPSDAQDQQRTAGLERAVAAIRFAAARLSDALRVEQPRVGLVGEIPTALALTATDLATGRDLPLPVPLDPGFPMMVGLPPLTRDDAIAALRDGVAPPRALLSQARYLTLPTSSPQPGLAILLAAAAAENHAKRSLRSRLPSERSLKALQKQDGTAAGLYGQIAKQVLGRSLEHDDPALWADLLALFNARNKMAHRLAIPTHMDTRQMVAAAMRAMDWLG